LDCHQQTILNALEGVNLENTVEVQVQTGGGLQGVNFILEAGVVQVLKTIRRSSRIKKETRESAEDLYDRFAVAGFKLYAMLQVAPEALKEMVDRHVAPEQPKETIALPPADIRVANLVSALDRLGVDLTNPRFNQELQDFSLDLVLGRKALPATQPEEWLGVVEKAERLGYSIALITSNRSQLGKYVASCNLASRKERRLCNGTMRDINLYHDCEALENAIGEFLDAKILSTAL
jgi:hypothetical protein